MAMDRTQQYFLEVLGRYGYASLPALPWERIKPRLVACWEESPLSQGLPWQDVEAMVHASWTASGRAASARRYRRSRPVVEQHAGMRLA
jgi:hypothetical protein